MCLNLFISLSTTQLPLHSTPPLSQHPNPLFSETSPAHTASATLPLSSTYASLSPTSLQSVSSSLISDLPSKSLKFVTSAYTLQNSNSSPFSRSKSPPSINYSHTLTIANTAAF